MVFVYANVTPAVRPAVTRNVIPDPMIANQPTRWTFFSNHAHVLFALSRDADIRIRDVASAVGITERAAQRIVTELAEDGYIIVDRVGRRNHYRVCGGLPLRHPLEAHRTVDDLLVVINAGGDALLSTARSGRYGSQ